MSGVHDDLATLKAAEWIATSSYAASERVEAEIARLAEQRDILYRANQKQIDLVRAAEARCARLEDGLRRWFGDGTQRPPLDILSREALREVDETLRVLLTDNGAA